MSGLPSNPDGIAATNVTTAASDKPTKADCNRLNLRLLNCAPSNPSRQRMANIQAANSNSADHEYVLKPKPSNIHSWVRNGERRLRPIAMASTMKTINSPQYKIAGPTPPPPAYSTHRSAGMRTTVLTLLLGSCRSMLGARVNSAAASLDCQLICTRCAPGNRARGSTPFSGRTGTVCPSTITAVICAVSGNRLLLRAPPLLR